MSISFSSIFQSPFQAGSLRSSAAASVQPAPEERKSAKQEFLDFAQLTPAERIHASILAQMGLTEEEFRKMDAKAQQEIEDKVREEIRKQVEQAGGKQTGLMVDISV